MSAPLRLWLLSFVAGFSDTTTFLGLGGLFSAHVTGSLVLLAASLGHGWHSQDALKILTLPLFAATATAAGRFKTRFVFAQWLYLEANLLMLAGLFGLVDRARPDASLEAGVMACAVIGMAIQTYAGRLYPQDCGLTTVMSNNIVQVIINLPKPRDNPEVRNALRRDISRLFGFAVGCIVGALMAQQIGMSGFVVMAFLVMFVANGSQVAEAPMSPALRPSGMSPATPHLAWSGMFPYHPASSPCLIPSGLFSLRDPPSGAR